MKEKEKKKRNSRELQWGKEKKKKMMRLEIQ
jgi:hypothetical protein